MLNMKAAVRKNYVAYKDIEVTDISMPEIKDDQILVKVHYTTVNRTDCAIVTGKPYIMRLFVGLLKPKNKLIGTDFVGEVREVGSAVSNYKKGDRVMGFRDEGIHSQAEYMAVSVSEPIAIIPKNVSYKSAVGSLEAPHYAYAWIKDKQFGPDQKILINGATGAIGSTLLQFMNNHSCQITAVANTKNLELIKSMGAEKVYNYETEDFTKDLKKYDYIFDAVGKSTFGKCKHLLKPNGIYLSSELGPYWQNPFLAILTSLSRGKKVVFPLPSDIPSSITYMRQLLSEGKFDPVIDRVYPLEEISDAYKYVASGQKTGNVILSIIDSN